MVVLRSYPSMCFVSCFLRGIRSFSNKLIYSMIFVLEKKRFYNEVGIEEAEGNKNNNKKPNYFFQTFSYGCLLYLLVCKILECLISVKLRKQLSRPDFSSLTRAGSVWQNCSAPFIWLAISVKQQLLLIPFQGVLLCEQNGATLEYPITIVKTKTKLLAGYSEVCPAIWYSWYLREDTIISWSVLHYKRGLFHVISATEKVNFSTVYDMYKLHENSEFSPTRVKYITFQ